MGGHTLIQTRGAAHVRDHMHGELPAGKNLPEASAVDKGEFRNFFNHGVTKVHTLKQSTAVTRVRSNSHKGGQVRRFP